MTVGVCAFPECPQPVRAFGRCGTHHWQWTHHGQMWQPNSRRRQHHLSEAQSDHALLLIAMGATTDEAAGEVGFTANGHYLTARLRDLASPQALRDALSARAATPHGTLGRYNRGCRCVDCSYAHTKIERKRQGRDPEEQLRSRRTRQTPAECLWINQRMVKTRNDALLDRAHHRYQVWTGPEMETALATAPNGNWLRSAPQVAALLGRTVGGVAHIRRRAHSGDPRAAP